MNYYEFQFFTTDPNYTFDQLSFDIADIFYSFTENPFITSVDIASVGGEQASLLVGTGFLTINELTEMFIEKFNEYGRDPHNYILLPPDTVEL